MLAVVIEFYRLARRLTNGRRSSESSLLTVSLDVVTHLVELTLAETRERDSDNRAQLIELRVMPNNPPGRDADTLVQHEIEIQFAIDRETFRDFCHK